MIESLIEGLAEIAEGTTTDEPHIVHAGIRRVEVAMQQCHALPQATYLAVHRTLAAARRNYPTTPSAFEVACCDRALADLGIAAT